MPTGTSSAAPSRVNAPTMTKIDEMHHLPLNRLERRAEKRKVPSDRAWMIACIFFAVGLFALFIGSLIPRA